MRSDRVGLPALWIALALVLSAFAAQMRDWFDMTDELRYERLAIAIARTHSLVPRVHGVDIRSFSQLYPLVISPAFSHGLVATDLRHAHVLGAWVMSSACFPAFLLARRVVARRWAAYVVAALAVCMPWIVYSSFLMTEVAAYPAFLWALLAMQRAIVAPSWLRDLVALAAIAVAFFARAELIVLVAVLPVALVAFELGRARGRAAARLRDGLLASVRAHPLLTAGYVAIAAGALVLALAGRLSSTVGVYGVYSTSSNLLPRGLPGSLAEHVATFSLALAVLPFVVGMGWLLANLVRPAAERERHAFACAGSIAAVAMFVQSTEFDLHYTGYVHDRFLLYLVPVIVIAALCAVTDPRPLRWSLVVPAAVVALGFGAGALPAMTWADANRRVLPDTPASIFYDPVVRLVHGLSAARVLLVTVTVVATVLFGLAAARLRRERSAALLTGLMLVALPVLTGYVLKRVFDVPGWSGRPLTQDPSAAFDWLDRTIGTRGRATVVPAPVSSDWFVSEQFWRDFEWWNKSVVRDVQYPDGDRFEYTGIWFPKLYVSFDERTGTASLSPTPWAVQSLGETRFRLSGRAGEDQNGVRLIHAGRRWRADWLTLGAYDDGWTMPGVATRVRVFARPGQRGPLTRYLTIHVSEPAGRPIAFASNLQSWRGAAPARQTMQVCVPAHGFADVRLTADGVGPIPGDQRNAQEAQFGTRRGGVHIGDIALADEVGGPCRPRP